MRKANTNDLFNMARLINSLELKENLFNAQKGTDDIEKIGFEFVFDVISKATNIEAQKKIYSVLAEPFEMEVDEVGLMPIDELSKNFLECWNINVLLNFTKRVGNMV